MKVSSPLQHRIIRVLTVALAVVALAASTASAMPAPLDQPTSTSGEPVVIEPAPVVQTVDNGFDWDSAAIGAGAAGALLLLVSLGGFTYRSRHQMNINH
jgi:hypothetical protein